MAHLYMDVLADELRSLAAEARKEKEKVESIAKIDRDIFLEKNAGRVDALVDMATEFEKAAQKIDNLNKNRGSTLDDALEAVTELQKDFKSQAESLSRPKDDFSRGRDDKLKWAPYMCDHVINNLNEYRKKSGE